MVLLVSLLILSVLMAAGVGAMIAVRTDFKITANLRSATQAFYLAESGIEWGKMEIHRSPANPPSVSGGTQPFSAGHFSVSFFSPERLSPLSAKIVIRSTSAIRGSAHTIQAEVTKSFDLSDGAIGLRGEGSRITFDGGSLLADGRDYDPATGEVVPGVPAHAAITVSEDALKERIENDLVNLETAELVGELGNPSGISRSDLLPPNIITALANELCAAPHAITTSLTDAGTLSLSDQTWGTRTSPELRCVQGLSGPGDAVNLAGNFAGAGILVVRDAELIVGGAFRWDGLVIVTGDNVGFGVVGEENKEIYGSVVVNETAPAAVILTLRGVIKVLYSGGALDGAAALIPESVLENLYGSLPAKLTQNYWRVITP